jgi:hypothetical protein
MANNAANFIEKYIHILISIFSVTAGIYAFRQENFAIPFCVVIILSFFGFVLIIKRERKKTLKVTKEYHNFCHELRDLIMELYLDFPEIESFDKNGFENKFLNGLTKVTDMVSIYFSSLLEVKVSTCIKTTDVAKKEIRFTKDKQSKWIIKKGDLYLHTMARSSNTHRDRFDSKIFPIEAPKDGNTAFEKIMDDNEPWFIDNNLKKLMTKTDKSSKGRKLYKNLTDNFFEYYNSTIVVPVRYCLKGSEKYDVVAILAIDAKKTNAFKFGFKDEILTYLLGAFADGLYLYARLFKKLEKKGDANGKAN